MKKLITAVFAFAFCLGVSANAVAQTNQQPVKQSSHQNNSYAQGRQMTQQLNKQADNRAQQSLYNALPVIHEYVYEDITEIKIPARHESRLGRMFTSYYNEGDDFYSNFKKNLQESIGLSYGFDASLTLQRGAPNGKEVSWQQIYYPYAQSIVKINLGRAKPGMSV